MGDLLIQGAVGHHHHQVPFRIGQLGTKQVAALIADNQHGGIILFRVHSGLEFLNVLLGIFAAQVVKNGVDTVKIVIPVCGPAADDKGAVPPDDMGVHHAALVVKREGVADIVHRDGRHQGGAGLSAGHGVRGGDAHQHQLVPPHVGSHGDFFSAVVQGGQKGLRIGYGQIAAVEGFKGAVSGVKGQMFKAPGLSAVYQILYQGALRLAAGGVGFHQGLHLAQPQIHGGLKVQGDLLAHAGHVDFAHIANGVSALQTHVKRQEGEDADAEEGDGNQADR